MNHMIPGTRCRHQACYLPLIVSLVMPSLLNAQELAGISSVVQVFGQGKTRQVQEVTRTDLREAVPGTNALKVLEKLPGVSFQSADAAGSYEWSTHFGIRGFSQNQLGFTLDGVPLGDMSYANSNGLHISRAISSENLGGVTVSQGAGAVGTASTSNLGGTVQFVSAMPAREFVVTGAQLLGSHDATRSFVRLDTGELAGGGKGYISLTRQRADKWKGWGTQEHDLLNTKWVQPLGESRLTAFFNLSDRLETDYQDMSLEMTRRLGWDWDNYAPDWSRAVAAANGVYSGKVTNVDDAYYLGRGLRQDALGGATLDTRLGEVDWKATVYTHRNRGQGHWYTPAVYAPAQVPGPISIRTTEYAISRVGLINDLTWDVSGHALNAGLWLERSKHGLERNFYAVDGPENTAHFLSNPAATSFSQRFITTTVQAYAQDTIHLLDERLTLNVGVKSPRVRTDASSEVGSRAAGRLVASEPFLPQLGVNFALSRDTEVFASATRNMRAFQPGVIGPFAQTQAVFDTSSSQLKPETSTSYDLGYRFKGQLLNGSVAAYHVDFSDRLLAVDACPGIVGCTTFLNVGKVVTNGIEAALLATLSPTWSWFNSLTLNESIYKSDYVDNGALIPARGKHVVDSPRVMWTTELAYETDQWFARAGAKYTGRRYYTYVNDVSVPGFALASLTAGYRVKAMGDLRDVVFQVNVDNLFDKHHFATVGSNGYANSDPTGSFATLLHGAPRQVFFSVSGKL